jgi:hypothetical protein
MTEVAYLQFRSVVDPKVFDIGFFDVIEEIYNIVSAIELGVYIRANWLNNF